MGQGSGVAVICGVVSRCSLAPGLLWLWCRPADAALILLLAWELPYTLGAALKHKNKEKTNKKTTGVPAVVQRAMDLALSLQWLRFNSWPGNFYIL